MQPLAVLTPHPLQRRILTGRYWNSVPVLVRFSKTAMGDDDPRNKKHNTGFVVTLRFAARHSEVAACKCY